MKLETAAKGYFLLPLASKSKAIAMLMLTITAKTVALSLSIVDSCWPWVGGGEVVEGM